MADDTLALLTREEAYQAINDPTTAAAVAADRDDEFIGVWVPAISRRVDELCGPVVVRTVTDERHDGGDRVVWLRKSPALTVTTVTEYCDGVATVLTAEQDDTLPNDGYLLETLGATSFIHRRCAGHAYRFAYGMQNVKVTYEAGRYATTAAVDAKFKMAASAILQQMWKKYAGAWASGGDPFAEVGVGTAGFFNEVDKNVKTWLADEMRAPGGGLMATNTTVLAVEDKLVALFDAATTVPVTYAWPGPAAAQTCVFLGIHPEVQDILLDQSSEDPVITAGRRQSQEEYRITATIWAFRPDLSSDGARQCAGTAHAVYDDLYDVLVNDAKIGLTSILHARPDGYERRLYPFQKGWACDFRFFVNVQARLT